MIFRRNRSAIRFPERRRHVRIVTLRNFGWLTLALLLAFAAISYRSELRGRHMHDYGRLVHHQLPENIERAPLETVEEATAVPESQRPPDAMTIIPADQPPPLVPVFQQQAVPARGDSGVAIVGGPEGVSVVQQKPRRRVLSGGFGR
jgi:hypothetical protein